MYSFGVIAAQTLAGTIMEHYAGEKIRRRAYTEGKKDGYQEASYQYESKLLQQAEEFLKQKDKFKEEKEAYEQLLDDYEAEIRKEKEKIKPTREEDVYLAQLLLMKNALLELECR